MARSFSLPDEYRRHVPGPLMLSVTVDRSLSPADAKAILQQTDDLMKHSEKLLRQGTAQQSVELIDAANAVARFCTEVAAEIVRIIRGGDEPRPGGRANLRAV